MNKWPKGMLIINLVKILENYLDTVIEGKATYCEPAVYSIQISMQLACDDMEDICRRLFLK